MNKICSLLLILITHFLWAQNVYLDKVVKTHLNSDKFLYKISGSEKNSEMLGEIEVQGFSANDVEVFGQIYKKAKQIGANAFSFSPQETLDGSSAQFDPFHYRLRLFYLPAADFPKEENTVYIISGKDETVKVKFNAKTITLEPRSFIKKRLNFGEDNDLSAGKLLGTRIKLAAKNGQPALYFSVESFNVKADANENSGGIAIKSGDIIALEKSFAQFLLTIYKELR